ncbi:hypothetical protein BofuT4_P125030.1 [Botrytis cinerea T4]|uniref:Uncharacterized protein n=1 Tax=Botryotinia fuckeliana (strain T4) TaxID=999810 RepID=G2YS57_BOTF4|nr:hypothetical protein BofuT4_P125030.1 [Botrytis cinerea T4]
MDGLGAAASVIAVVQMAQAVGGALVEYYEGVKSARDDIQRLYNSIKNLESVLRSVDDLPRTFSINIQASLENKTGTLSLCKAELDGIKKELDAFSKQQNHIGKLKSLIWPFKKKDVDKLVDFIDKHKHDLMLAFGVENLHISLRHHGILEDIRSEIGAARSEIGAAQSDKERSQIIKWLAKSLPDPSTEHDIARKKFQKGTGSWLKDGDSLKIWSKTSNSFLWLNGGAGAGKSILCSTVIDHIQEFCKQEPNVVVTYWYIKFDDSTTQSISNIIRSWIKDICSNRRDTPQTLKDTYALCNHGQQQPTHEKMMEMLKCVVGGFQDVYLIVDALDEYPKTDRYLLLKTLKEIHQWKIDSIHIFVTSRVEDDIRVHLANMSERNVFDNCKWIMVQDPNITEDIKKFLAAKIDSSEYDIPTSDLEEEVVESIARRADGMFRLAALQLESLKPYQTIFEIRKGLNQLPRSLDVFYRRALEEVFEGHQCYVKIALQWIAYSARPLKLVELSEAVAVQTESSPYLEEDRKLICKGDRFPLVDMIPSAFVTIHIYESGDPSLPFKEKSYIRFSHYSVQEFLQSTRTSNGPVKQYHLQESNGLESIAARCIAYLLYVGSFFEDSYSGLPDVHNRFPLIYHAVLCWTYYLQRLEILSNGSFNLVGNLRELASLLMSGNQATSTNHDAWKISQIICKDARRKIPYSATTLALAQYSFEIEIDSSIYIPCPLSWASHHGLISLVKLLLRDALYDISPSNASREFDLGSPLHAAATGWYFSERIVTLLLAAGMNPNTSGGELRYPLVAATDKNKLEICKLLCEGGANLDPGWGVRGETALQVACRKGYVDICKYLLEQGADIENCDFADDVAKHDFLDSLMTPLLLATKHRKLAVIKLLLVSGADIEAVYNGYTPLQYASEAHDVQACKWLLDSGSDVNHMTESVPFLTLEFPWRFRWTTSWTPLSRPFRVYPSFYPNDDLLVITELLLKAGADVHAKGGPWWKNGPMATTIVFCLECTRNLPESTEQREKHVLKKTLDMLLHAGAGSGLEGAEVLSILGGRREELKEERRELLRQREMNTRRSNDRIEEIDRFINSYDDAYNRVQEQQEKERKVSMRGVSTGDGVENEELSNGELSNRVTSLSL